MKIITILLLLFIPGLMAQDSAETSAVMDAKTKEILKKSVKAANLDSVKDVKSMVQKVDFSMIGMGMKGTITIHLKDKKIRTETKLPQMTEVEGFDGKDAWNESLATGVRILDGAEKLTMISQTLPYLFNPERFYDKIEFVEKVKFNNTECFKLKFSKKGLDPYIAYYDSSSYLPIGEERVIPTAMGKIKISASYSDYIKHEKGFKYPSKMIQTVGPTKVEAKIKEIIVDKAIEDKIFAVPAN